MTLPVLCACSGDSLAEIYHGRPCGVRYRGGSETIFDTLNRYRDVDRVSTVDYVDPLSVCVNDMISHTGSIM